MPVYAVGGGKRVFLGKFTKAVATKSVSRSTEVGGKFTDVLSPPLPFCAQQGDQAGAEV